MQRISFGVASQFFVMLSYQEQICGSHENALLRSSPVRTITDGWPPLGTLSPPQHSSERPSFPWAAFTNYQVWWGYWGRRLPARLKDFSDSWLWLKNSHWLSQNFLNAIVLESADPTLLPSYFSPLQRLPLHSGILCTPPLSFTAGAPSSWGSMCNAALMSAS